MKIKEKKEKRKIKKKGKKEGENQADKSWAVSMKGSDAVFVEIESISLGWFNDTYASNERHGSRVDFAVKNQRIRALSVCKRV